jgi:hypothetical protein
MPEGAEVPQASQPEQRSTSAQNAEARVEQPGSWVERVRQELQNQYEKDDQWLRENAENPEMAEQWRQLWENTEKLQGNLGQLSEIDQKAPISGKTKQKLSNADKLLRDFHPVAKQVGAIALGGSALLEGFSYLTGGPPGLMATFLMVPAAGVIGMGEGIGLTAKGIEKAGEGYRKLRGLIEKNTETGGNKT